VIKGVVSIAPIRQAQVDVRVGRAGGAEITVAAVVDTGFTEFLTLPLATIQSLALPATQATRIRLADGSYTAVDEYEARVWWHDDWRPVQIQACEGDVLLGMAMLVGHLLSVEVVASGAVAIEALE